ncbi:hypothetical protein SGRA_1166 [Saprospira grandis str. Lewin]|uniref:Uncharacterized protein n=1 Tax=Saprospira grandis (strain Lewin) TaxID=984262 RepID=H6L419_SAPGL|nr:hypothetical protein SGRA_1166 [Saprospira grandis str. Lewin]
MTIFSNELSKAAFLVQRGGEAADMAGPSPPS